MDGNLKQNNSLTWSGSRFPEVFFYHLPENSADRYLHPIKQNLLLLHLLNLITRYDVRFMNANKMRRRKVFLVIFQRTLYHIFSFASMQHGVILHSARII